MSIFKRCVALLPIISIAMATTATAKPEETQCVDITTQGFNLIPDPTGCSISGSQLVKSKAPDQEFLFNSVGVFPPTCFLIIDPNQRVPVVSGEITNEGGEILPIRVSGSAGLTENNYLNDGFDPTGTTGTQSFTAVSLLSILADDNTELGVLVTRDAGTVFRPVPDAIFLDVAAARLSVVKGQGVFSGATGYIDEIGMEFNPDQPATATGRLCGKGLADSLFKDS